MLAKLNTQIHKALYGIVLLVMVFTAFEASDTSTARVREALQMPPYGGTGGQFLQFTAGGYALGFAARADIGNLPA